MKKPSAENPLPDFSGQTKTLFVAEGNPAALLISNRAGRRSTKPMEFAQASAALAWCRRHGVMMVYVPCDGARN